MASIANEQTFYKMRDDEKRGFDVEWRKMNRWKRRATKSKLNVQEKWVARIKKL